MSCLKTCPIFSHLMDKSEQRQILIERNASAKTHHIITIDLNPHVHEIRKVNQLEKWLFWEIKINNLPIKNVAEKMGVRDQAAAIKVRLKWWFIIRLLMKLARRPCSIGNRLVGLSFYNPSSRTSRYARVISLKPREMQPTGPPEGDPLCFFLFSVQPWQLSLWLLLFQVSPQRNEGRTLNMIIRTARGVVFVIIWLNGGACKRLGFGKKWFRVGTAHNWIFRPWTASGSDWFLATTSQIGHYFCISYQELQQLILAVNLLVPFVSSKTKT